MSALTARVATRDKILETAMKLFAEKGFNGTTTKEIADMAGVNQALIFRYFSTKRELYGAIIEKKIEKEAGIDQALLKYKHTKDDLLIFKSIATRMFEKCGSDPEFIRLLHFSALEGHELSDMFFDTYVEYINTLVSEYIDERISEGAFRHVDPMLAAKAFIGMVINYIIVQELFGEKKKKIRNREEVVEAFAKIFLNGIKQT